MNGYLQTARTFYDPGGSATHLDDAALATGLKPTPGFVAVAGQLTKQGTVTAAVTTVAYVNQGRWVTACPFCNSAQVVSPTDPRFLCVCGNLPVQGAYITVAFPAAKTLGQIEAALLARPNLLNRNWLPTESPADLLAENIEQGVSKP